jgi:predicted membrane-bound spermidine synthase
VPAAEKFALRLAVFLGGAMLMAVEVAAFRIIGKTFGSALRETTAVIAVFLTAMSAGYWAGGRLGDRWPQATTLVAALLGGAATLMAVPSLDALLSARIAASRLDLTVHAFVATTLLFAIPTFFFAAISPIAVRLFATTTTESGSTAGGISALSTAGSIAGSVATAFFLIDWLQSITRTVLFVVAIGCATAVVVMLASTRRRFAIAASVALIVIPTAAFVRSNRIDYTPQPGVRTLFAGDSVFHRVTVRERNGVRDLRFNTAIQSQMRIGDPFGPGLDYPESFQIARLFRPTLRRVLIVGLGGGTGAKQLTRAYDDAVVDVVEIDPLVVDVAERFFAVQPGPRLRIHVSDGRTFLRRSAETWDLIVIDAYTTSRYGDTIPPHLTTREFFAEAAGHLSDGGVLHFHCAFTKSRLLPALQKTIGSVFGSVVVTEGEVLASNVALITAGDVLEQRRTSSPAARFPSLPRYLASLGPAPRGAASAPTLTDDYAPVDLLAHARN